MQHRRTNVNLCAQLTRDLLAIAKFISDKLISEI